jgi:hypothetical protein
MDKPLIQVFDNFQDADDYARSQRLQLEPSKLIELCFELSVSSWKLLNKKLPSDSLRNNPKILIKELHSEF